MKKVRSEAAAVVPSAVGQDRTEVDQRNSHRLLGQVFDQAGIVECSTWRCLQAAVPALSAEVPDDAAPDPRANHRQAVLGQLALEHEVVQAVEVLERQAGDQFEVGRQSVDTIRSIDLSSIGLPFRIDTYVLF
jgi:hypothetical protein